MLNEDDQTAAIGAACDLLSALRRDDDVELICSVDGRSEAAALRVVRVADVSDDSVEDDPGVLLHWADVLRQTDEERYTLWRRSRQSYTY